MRTILEFENSVLSSGMPIAEYDLEDTTQRGRRIQKGVNYSIVYPSPIKNPYVGMVSDECLKMIGLGDHKELD